MYFCLDRPFLISKYSALPKNIDIPENISEFSPNLFLNFLAKRFEMARENKDIDSLNNIIVLATSFNTSNFDEIQKASYYYFLGNAWGYIEDIDKTHDEFPFESDVLNNQIIYYRSALMHIYSDTNKSLKCQILTNLGNLLSSIGRLVEALDYYDKSLDLNKEFGMTIGNKGIVIWKYSKFIFDSKQQFIFLHIAHSYLSSCKKDLYEEATKSFEKIKNLIEKKFSKESLSKDIAFKDLFKGKSQKEIKYRKWCLENKLFLNPLNDINEESAAATDSLFTPSMTHKLNDRPIYSSIFNQIKQEYVSSRLIFYEGITSTKPHFSDRDVIIIDTLDYSLFSYSLEKLKISFRICYSILDKIAYFLNLYLELGENKRFVTFKNIWYEKGRNKNSIKEKILLTKNLPLRGLFWLSKDFFEEGIMDTIEPDAKELAKIRNFIEHKAFKIVEFKTLRSTHPDLFDIDRDSFINKSIKLLKLTRSAILYLSFLIYEEEHQRNQKRNPSEVVIPIYSTELNHRYKI